MSIETAMSKVESLAFSVAMNIVAGKTALMELMHEHPLYKDLREQVSRVKNRRRIVDRISTLAQKAIDPDYEHPDDIAFCAYLLILEELGSAAEVREAKELVSRAPNCAWADEIWPLIKVPPEAKSENVPVEWNGFCQEFLQASVGVKAMADAVKEWEKYLASLTEDIVKASKTEQFLAAVYELISGSSPASAAATASQELAGAVMGIVAAGNLLPDPSTLSQMAAPSLFFSASVALTQAIDMVQLHVTNYQIQHILQGSEPRKTKLPPAWQAALLSGNDYRPAA